MALSRCPVCGRPFEPELSPAMPFCGNRCRRIDLHRWLGEKYTIPVDPSDDPDAREDGSPQPGESGED